MVAIVLIGLTLEFNLGFDLQETFKMKKLLIAISMLFATHSIVSAADRLIIKDESDTTRFKIEDTGAMTTNGLDAINKFEMKVLGHVGGTNHTQIVTDNKNSRSTFMASTADDNAPRLFMIGPEDTTNAKGWAMFDFGSAMVDLPNAQFKVRHWQPGAGVVDMMRIYEREAVVFPQNDVVVGIRTDNPQYPLQVTTGGAYCDGNQWVDKSSREAKENIAELSRQEAFETLRNIKPVKFNYKKDVAKETNVGFIAEDVPELVATQDREGLVSMEVVAVLTKVVQEQQETIAKLTERVNNLEER